MSRPPELRLPIELSAGREMEIRAAFRPSVRGPEPGFVTMRLGVTPRLDEDRLLDDAVAAAADADVAVLVVGSAEGTESEGYDRDTLSLSGRQDELVRRVAGAQLKTVVIVNSGMPVLMPWVDDVAAIIQVWFPGQAFGEALADCMLGVVEPGGRLPISIPPEEGDSPVLHATAKRRRARLHGGSARRLPVGGVRLPELVGQFSLKADERRSRPLVRLWGDQPVAGEDAPDGRHRGRGAELRTEVVGNRVRAAVMAGLGELPARANDRGLSLGCDGVGAGARSS